LSPTRRWRCCGERLTGTPPLSPRQSVFRHNLFCHCAPRAPGAPRLATWARAGADARARAGRAGGLDDGEAKFGKFSLEERSKIERETVNKCARRPPARARPPLLLLLLLLPPPPPSGAQCGPG